MKNIIPFKYHDNIVFPLEFKEGENVVDSRILAQELDINHITWLRDTIRPHQTEIEQFGVVEFKTQKPPKGSQGGRPETFCYFNEDQALFISTLSKNTKKVVEVKVKIVRSFSKARKELKESQFEKKIDFVCGLATDYLLIKKQLTKYEGLELIFDSLKEDQLYLVDKDGEKLDVFSLGQYLLVVHRVILDKSQMSRLSGKVASDYELFFNKPPTKGYVKVKSKKYKTNLYKPNCSIFIERRWTRLKKEILKNQEHLKKIKIV